MFPEDCDQPLPAPPRRAAAVPFQDGLALAQVRAFAAEYARKAGLSTRRVADLVTSVHELAANTLRHTSAGGVLNMWANPGEVVCQVQDAGWVSDPLVGRRRPAPDAGHGHGLWVVHQLCDLVELRTGTGGTTIRLHMRLSP